MTQGLYVFYALIAAFCIFLNGTESKQRASLVSFVFFGFSALLFELHGSQATFLHWLFINVPMQMYGSLTLLMMIVLYSVKAPLPLIGVCFVGVILHTYGVFIDLEYLPDQLAIYNQFIEASNLLYLFTLMVISDGAIAGFTFIVLYGRSILGRLPYLKSRL